MKNSIGLDVKQSNELAERLNDLLANYQVFYQNLRAFHWNIKGKDFFELHVKFEELYNDAVIKIDEIAERILTLQGVPLHTMEDYLTKAEISSFKGERVDSDSVKIVAQNFSILLAKERVILAKATDVNDEGTLSQMSDYIKETEKTLWMLHAYLG